MRLYCASCGADLNFDDLNTAYGKDFGSFRRCRHCNGFNHAQQIEHGIIMITVLCFERESINGFDIIFCPVCKVPFKTMSIRDYSLRSCPICSSALNYEQMSNWRNGNPEIGFTMYARPESIPVGDIDASDNGGIL